MKLTDYGVVFLAVILVILLAWWQWFADTSAPARVIVRSAEKTVATLPLTRNQTLEVEGSLGTSIIEVEDGKVRFVESPCSNQQCILRGWAHKTGDAIACLPNRVSLTIVGQDTYFDAVNF